ncbi:MAG: DUF839 domain-containing protein [Acidimicrobiales bacterium]
MAGEPVGGTDHRWHGFPDGAACFPADDGGWIYVCNSEVTDLYAPNAGGVGAIRFTAAGEIADAYWILQGSTSNCAGGPTPWGTWMSCEEPIDKLGQLWECDPQGKAGAIAQVAMGRWRREAAAVDPEGEAVYMTEDEPDGVLYRYLPSAYPDLALGVLEAATVADDGTVTWGVVPNPFGVPTATKEQVAGATRFDGAEGIWYHEGAVFFTTKGDDRVHRLDVRDQVHSIIWDGDPETLGVEGAVLSGVDNITVDAGTGDIYVAEDGGNLEVVIISAEGEVAPFVRLVAEGHGGSEITGPCFNPDRSRLYFSSQRGPTPSALAQIIPGASQQTLNGGITYEVTGPFRGIAETTTTTVASSDGGAEHGSGDGRDGGGVPWPAIGIGAVAVAAVAGGAMAVRRRRSEPDEPVDDEPVDDEPVDDEPVDDEPVDDEPDE